MQNVYTESRAGITPFDESIHTPPHVTVDDDDDDDVGGRAFTRVRRTFPCKPSSPGRTWSVTGKDKREEEKKKRNK